MNIVVFLHPNLGDAVWHTVTLRWMREANPKARIVAVTGKLGVEILQKCGFADEVVLRQSPAKMLLWLLKNRFDLAYFVYPQNRFLKLAKIAKISTIAGVRGGKFDKYLDISVEVKADEHAILDVNWRLMRELGWPTSGPETTVNLDGVVVPEEFSAKLNSLALGYVALMPGASNPKKQWPMERFRGIAQRLKDKGLMTVAMGGPGEDWGDLADLDVSGKLSILEGAKLLQGARLLVTNDTGLMHLAGAVGTPVVGVYGALTPVTHLPPGDGHWLFCKPCACPMRDLDICTRDCIDSTTLEEVWAAVEEILE